MKSGVKSMKQDNVFLVYDWKVTKTEYAILLNNLFT